MYWRAFGSLICASCESFAHHWGSFLDLYIAVENCTTGRGYFKMPLPGNYESPTLHLSSIEEMDKQFHCITSHLSLDKCPKKKHKS